MVEKKSRLTNVSLEELKRRRDQGVDVSNSRAVVRIGPENTRILLGMDDLEDWDDEELLQGRRRSSDGAFRGRRPRVVPTALHRELIRRTLSEAQEEMRSHLVKAVQSLTDIATGADVDDKARIQAIKMIMDRVMGKEIEQVNLTVEEKPNWMKALEVSIVEDDDDIIDAEIVGEP